MAALRVWLPLWLVLTWSSPLSAGLGEPPSPLSYSRYMLTQLKDADAALDYLRREISRAAIRAHLAALGADVFSASCCYYAVSLYAQLERGLPLAVAQIRLPGTRPQQVQQLLARTLGHDMLYYDDINTTADPAQLALWLGEHLTEGEPALITLLVRRPHDPAGELVGHSVNALVIRGQAYVIDAGHGGQILEAAEFFRTGAGYRVELSQPVGLLRSLRDGVQYRFDARQGRYWLNDHLMTFTEVPADGQQTVSGEQLRQYIRAARAYNDAPLPESEVCQ